MYHVLRAHFDGFRSSVCPQSPPPVREEDGNVVFDTGKRVVGVMLRDHCKSIVVYDDLATGERKDQEADVFIVADGANSTLRRDSLSPAARPYSGYVAWRGTVPESEVSDEILGLMGTKSNLFQLSLGIYVVAYLTPSESGGVEPGSRSVNWIRYETLGADLLQESMTDTSGHFHRNTVPMRRMQRTAWEGQVERAQSLGLARPLVELMCKIKSPFITAVTDIQPPAPSSIELLYDNRVFFVGEAFSLCRSHLGVSANQAALHALNVVKVIRGEITRRQFNVEAMGFYRYYSALTGVVVTRLMGTRIMLLICMVKLLIAIVRRAVGLQAATTIA